MTPQTSTITAQPPQHPACARAKRLPPTPLAINAPQPATPAPAPEDAVGAARRL
ncbi:hypothetical protein [Synechococcus sp. MVIR-18-1]|uniref:hypothetical protein n=1 Tax=Synechococcus sp. MVIR-18-1 TaxID=1386941 RepID=UPI001644BD7F|nr:hypothetical protein [Synechococcus sp. MVIR-18-1]